MSDLRNPTEVAEWLREWREHYRGNPERLALKLEEVAAEQEENYRDATAIGVASKGQARAVSMLLRAAKLARKAAAPQAKGASGKIVAYYEQESYDPETGAPGVLRKEWRVRKVASYAPEELTAAWGSDWRRYKPFATLVLEMRYVRRGVEEPWTPHAAGNDLSQVLEAIDSGPGLVPVHPALVRMLGRQKQAREERAAAAKAERAAEAESERRRRAQERAARTFDKLLASEKFRAWGERWNAFVAARRDDPSLRALFDAKDPQFMALYEAATGAETVPSRAKAIRLFLARYGDEETQAQF